MLLYGAGTSWAVLNCLNIITIEFINGRTLTNLIFLNKMRYILLTLCHKSNIGTYVEYMDLKNFCYQFWLKNCIDKIYLRQK